MKRVVLFLLKLGVIFAVWLLVMLTMAFFYYSADLPLLEDLEKQDNKQSVSIRYNDGEQMITFDDAYRSEVEFYELPQHLIDAVVATEDRKFFNHNGIDIFGMIRASYVNHKKGRIVQGASTITQQLAKMLFLNPQRTFKRKIQEVLLALQLEKKFTKEQILTFYLNRAYFGSGSYGIGSAARFYFDKSVSELNLNESAILVGLLKAPTKLSPKTNKSLAKARANVVLHNMVDAGFITKKNIKEVAKPISYHFDNSLYLYFADLIHEQYDDFLDKTNSKKNVTIFTTLDEKLQQNLEDRLNNFIQKNSKKLHKSQMAVVVMNKDGAILAMVGGKNYKESQFNRAVYAKRQAGSTFKTFVYLTAFENGFKPNDIFVDKKVSIGNWIPENFNNRYYGNVTLKHAFANSLNSVAVQLANKLGTDKIIETASKLGITSEIKRNDQTIALGSSEVSLLELTTAYATIANDGTAVIPYYINKIEDDKGHNLYERHSSGLGNVISETAQGYLKEIMHEVVSSGSGKSANVVNNIYGKTGTSQNFRDAWFIGFNDKYVIGIWIGNDDNSATNKITGGSLPAQFAGEMFSPIKN